MPCICTSIQRLASNEFSTTKITRRRRTNQTNERTTKKKCKQIVWHRLRRLSSGQHGEIKLHTDSCTDKWLLAAHSLRNAAGRFQKIHFSFEKIDAENRSFLFEHFNILLLYNNTQDTTGNSRLNSVRDACVVLVSLCIGVPLSLVPFLVICHSRLFRSFSCTLYAIALHVPGHGANRPNKRASRTGCANK